MKKLLSIALCATAVSAFAVDESSPKVADLGTVGVTKIDSGLRNTIVAVSYDDLAGASGMVVSNFVKTTNLTVNDQLAIFTNGEYTTWTLKQSGTDGPKYWEKNEKAFKVDADGKLTVESGEASSDVTQAVGTGIWLVRQDVSKPFYIYGKPVSNPTSTTVAGAWTLIGNPNQTGSKAFEIDTVSKPTDGDQIVAPKASDGTLCYYTYKAGKGWRTTNSTGDGWSSEKLTLGAGLGCWIHTENTSTINW